MNLVQRACPYDSQTLELEEGLQDDNETISHRRFDGFNFWDEITMKPRTDLFQPLWRKVFRLAVLYNDFQNLTYANEINSYLDRLLRFPSKPASHVETRDQTKARPVRASVPAAVIWTLLFLWRAESYQHLGRGGPSKRLAARLGHASALSTANSHEN
jgi:hypothetical protein